MNAEWSDRKAWTYLAERWAVAANQGSAKARVLRESMGGLCGSLVVLEKRRRITRTTFGRLFGDMYLQSESKEWGYWWPRTVRGAASRAVFCRRMARAARRVER